MTSVDREASNRVDVVADRQPAPHLRDLAAEQRNLDAARRDEAGARRDEAAERRDRQAEARDEDVTNGAAQQVARAAAADRNHAHQDRVAAADDRDCAATDRYHALADQMAAAGDRRAAGLDSLTGIYNRPAGLIELERDLSRTSRSSRTLVVAFVDVDHLKFINDTLGHAAGDRALIAVADTLTAALRPYDLVIRYGGDEFLCVIEGIDVAALRFRFADINRLLIDGRHGVTVSVGLARLAPDETGEELIARADTDLYLQRRRRRQ